MASIASTAAAGVINSTPAPPAFTNKHAKICCLIAVYFAAAVSHLTRFNSGMHKQIDLPFWFVDLHRRIRMKCLKSRVTFQATSDNSAQMLPNFVTEKCWKARR
jgi:hypothetical protein